MDIRTYISDIQKLRSVNNTLQIKLGELTLHLNNSAPFIQNWSEDLILVLIKTIQGFLCHNFYNDYISLKNKEKLVPNNLNTFPDMNDSKEANLNSYNNLSNTFNNNQSSIYDNCMNLILVILAKLSKLNSKFAKFMIQQFAEHITNHVECFNYIISFYRLYINCSNIRQEAKTNGLYNTLFLLYKKVYLISHKIELGDHPLDLMKLRSDNEEGEGKYFIENFLKKKETNENVSFPNSLESKRILLNNKLNPPSNKKRFSILNSFINPNLSSEKTFENFGLSPDISDRRGFTSGMRFSSNDFPGKPNESEKKKIPDLKLEFNNLLSSSEKQKAFQPQITRSSQRNEFSKSGGGGSTYHTGNLRDRLITTKRFFQEETAKKEIIIDSTISTRSYEIDKNFLPKETLKKLALELGESCLAVDLASLINHKREMELERVAKGCSSKNERLSSSNGLKNLKISEANYITKLKQNNTGEFYEDEFDDKLSKNDIHGKNKLVNLLNKKPLIVDKNEALENNKPTYNNSTSIKDNILDLTRDIKKNFIFSFDNQMVGSQVDKVYRNYIKIREIITNFILSCISEYSIDELHLVKININLIYCFLALPSFEHFRKKSEKRKIEQLENLQEFVGDFRHLVSEGSHLITDKENIKTGLLNFNDSNDEVFKKNFKSNIGIKEKFFYTDSFVSMNIDEDKNGSLILKSEYEALFDILSLNSYSVEHIVKSETFKKEIFRSVDNPLPDKFEMWSSGIMFSNFSRVNLNSVRSHSDVFLDKIKNKIMFILKYLNIEYIEKNQNKEKILFLLKQQFDLLKNYLHYSKSKIIYTSFVFEMWEIMIIMKRKFIEIFMKGKDDLKLIDKLDITEISIPEILLDLYVSYLEVLSNVILNTNNFACEKLINDLFITCPYFLGMQKLILNYVLTKEFVFSDFSVFNKLKNENELNKNKGVENDPKLNLTNLLKEAHNYLNNPLFSNYISKVIENYQERLRMALVIINYNFNITVFYHKIIRKENLDKNKNEEKDLNKYWLLSIREYLHFLNFFLNTKQGIIFNYLVIYGSYMKSPSNINDLLDRHNLISNSDKQISIINFSLTRAVLNLQNSVFQFSHHFSLIVNENTSLDFIRYHYISFIKLYNKNMDVKAKLGDVGKLLENCDLKQRKKKVKVLIKDIYNDQSNLQVIINLCKLHLTCLFSLSKNRNVDVTNKFYQLRIVDFMVKELDLEHESAEKLYKAKNYVTNKSYSESENKNLQKYNASNELTNFTLDLKTSINDTKIQNKKEIVPLNLDKEINKKGSAIFKYLPKQETVIEVKDEDSKYSKNVSISDEGEGEGDNIQIKNITDSHRVNLDENKNIKKEPSSQNKTDCNKSKHSEKSQSEFEDEENESYGSDLSDIMLVDLKPKVNIYDKIIPKLSFIPTTLSETTLGGKLPNNKMSIQINKTQATNEPKEVKVEKNEKKEINIPLAIPNKTTQILTTENEKTITNLDETNPDINKSKFQTIIKPENVQVDINEESLNFNFQNFIPDNSILTDYSKGSAKVTPHNTTPVIKNSQNSNRSKNKSKVDDQVDQLKIKLKEKSQESESFDIINYSGNGGNPKKSENIPKLDIRNIGQDSKAKIKNINEDVELVNIYPPHHKSSVQENLEKSIKEQKVNKIQLAFENMLKKKYNLFYRKATVEELKQEDLSNLNIFYTKERNNRLLYQDQELQALIVALIASLIITPLRGTLDEQYCSYYSSFESNKINSLFILQHHLNHQENQDMLPLLLKFVSEISPYGAGQRLIKLLCANLFDASIYKDWQKIASGAYGQVYQCSTNIAELSTVAIKKINVAENIYDFCHLFDIFTEITALETFRMEGCVTHLFDYGVDSESYYIVMKKYQMSLKDWRTKQTNSLEDMLPIYLNIYKEILSAIYTIHKYKTTHYDIKCDNVVIDFNNSFQGNSNCTFSDDRENTISVKIADFGECKIFISEKDEFCVRSRGTNVIKSPEMLKNYGYQVKTDDDNYDRRKKMATTRSSDIWSLGCLFYELLTGNFLFEEIETDYFGFMYKANTLTINELLSEDKLKHLNNNPYLIDFLKFMLVKDQNYRPNIETIINRFEHVHALLVNIGGASNNSLNINSKRSVFSNNVESSVETCQELIQTNNEVDIKNIEDIKLKWVPNMMKISSEVYLADLSYSENNDKLHLLGITHVVSWTKSRNKNFEKLFYLNILEDQSDMNKSIFYHFFKVMDFLRHCMIYRGVILFVDDFQFLNVPSKPNFLIRSLILLCFSDMLNLNAYDTWTYINSKVLFFWLPSSSLAKLSLWVLNKKMVNSFSFSHPVVRCLCGACVLILKKNYVPSNNSSSKKCNCSKSHNNHEFSECPSNGCQEYIQDMKNMYGFNYESLNWATYTSEDFLLGPKDISFSGYKYYQKIVCSSRGLDENIIQHSLNVKKSLKIISKKTEWVLNKCRICQVWLFGEGYDKFQVLVNNLYNVNKKIEQKKTRIKSNTLNNLKLSKLL